MLHKPFEFIPNLLRFPLQPLNGCLALILACSCASHKPQYATPDPRTTSAGGEAAFRIFLAGGLGNGPIEQSDPVLRRFRTELATSGPDSEILFLGDLLPEEVTDSAEDRRYLDAHLQLIEDFKGKATMIPGNNEWKYFDTDRMKPMEDYAEDKDSDLSFQLVGECPVDYREINDKLAMILIDSKWFISNWGRTEHMNRDCPVMKTRQRFAEELEGYINDAQGKNLLVVMHHPVFSNGKFAGNETFKSHMSPLPVVGSLIKTLADLGAFSPEMLDSRRYNYFRILLTALAQKSERVVFLSGHEESLQYLKSETVRQLVSGSLGRATATYRSGERLTTVGGSIQYEGVYTEGARGFARLDIASDGAVTARFYPGEKDPVEMQLLPALPVPEIPEAFNPPPTEAVRSRVLDNPGEWQKGGFYEFLWGKRYRKYFSEMVQAPPVLLDTLYGGLTVTKKGGGHQSYSIRLEDGQGREYSMRSLRKDALKFLAFKVRGVAYHQNDYRDTWAEDVVSDFFSTAHPYMQLVISPLARSVGVNHSSPSLFYVPKQEALGELNSEFGDELYFIEERPSDEQLNFRGYRRAIDEQGTIKDFESTTDMMALLRDDESYSLDQRAFIRARLFDMLIGDWDRHQDQWRWVEYEKPDGATEFMPIPRDRDNAFPRFDGFALGIIQWFAPGSRRFQSFGPDYGSIKWLNTSGGRLDKVLINQYGADAWEEEARKIQQGLGDAEIENAFLRLPEAVRDQTAEEIKAGLRERLQRLPEVARQYGKSLERTVILHGTDKDDIFEIDRLPDGNTRVRILRNLSDEPNELFFEREFSANDTREIWIYGLNDDDRFVVSGKASGGSFIRLIGGYGEDSYSMVNTSRIKVYDWEYETSEFPDATPSKSLTTNYPVNTFHWRYYEEDFNMLVPSIGFRVDDGFFAGAKNTYTKMGFNGDDFQQQHSVSARYFFHFGALEASYSGVFAEALPNWDLELDAYYASNRFVRNFFGIGNQTNNREDALDIDFYRSRLERVGASAALAYHTLRFKGLYESHRAVELADRFFTPANLDPEVFERQHYLGAETSMYYSADDAEDFPSKALYFGLTAGYKWNTDLSDNQFGYMKFRLAFSHKVIPSGDLVLGSTAEVRTNFGDNYFFYHAPAIGGNNGLRGFRDERFAGKTYFFQNTDLRWRIKRTVTLVAPVTYGIYGGFDYGRVWQPGEDSSVWHTSQGGGIWISGFNFLAFNLGYFNSREGNMFHVGFGFGF